MSGFYSVIFFEYQHSDLKEIKINKELSQYIFVSPPDCQTFQYSDYYLCSSYSRVLLWNKNDAYCFFKIVFVLFFI